MVEADKRAGEDDARLVAQRLGEHARSGRTCRRGPLPGLHERDAGLAQRVQAGGDRELRRDVERLDELARARRTRPPGRTTGPPASLITSAVSSIVSKRPLPSSPFTSRVTCLSAIPSRKRSGMRSTNCSPRRMRSRVLGVHHRLSAPGQAQPGAGDDDGASGRALRSKRGGAAGCAESLRRSERCERALESIGTVSIWLTAAGCRCRQRARTIVAARPRATRARTTAAASRRAVRRPAAEPAQRVVEGLDLARLGVVREERDDAGRSPEDVVHEALERLLGADLHERPHAFGVQRLEALDPLHRRGDLPARCP